MTSVPSPMKKNLSLTIIIAGIVGLVGCSGDSEPEVEPPVDLVFQGVPVLPLSTVVGQSGSASAVQTDLFAPAHPDSAAGWYRRRLIALDWEIESDNRTPDGVTTIYATRDGPPLWVILRPNGSVAGTSYSMIGALIDTVRVNEASGGPGVPTPMPSIE